MSEQMTPLLLGQLLVNLPAEDRDWIVKESNPFTLAALAAMVADDQISRTEFRHIIQLLRKTRTCVKS